MPRQDSIFSPLSETAYTDTAVSQPTKPQTPYQVLRLLPKDATPAQQDSAIQAWFEPSEIHYSQQPDTLHLPGHGVPRDPKVVDIPQYYRENYFSNDSLYHPELNGGRYGVAGDPVPYTISNDNVITGLLVFCFLLIAFVFSRLSWFIVHQIKDFFYVQKGEHTMTETGNEVKLQMHLVVLTCIVFALLYYFYTTNYVASTFNLSSEYQLLGIFGGVFAGYFLLRFLLYTMVNNVFFDGRKNKKFLTSLLFITSLEGILLFPSVLLLAYFHIPPQSVVYYCATVIVLAKILTFYKAHVTFFRQNADFLQIILYFCALEMIPLFALWGGLAVIVNFLKVNF